MDNLKFENCSVEKRNGTKEAFNIDKIKNALLRAWKEVYGTETKENIDEILDNIISFLEKDFSVQDCLSVEYIQDMIEEELMDNDYDVAKAYILYREKHKHIRDWADKKIQFIENYKQSDNTANATIDDNSNVSNHNIAVLNSEIHKEDNIQVNLKILENKLKELYPDFNYKLLYQDLNTIAYLHDASSQIGMEYCMAVTLYPFLRNGLKDIGGLSAKPKSLESFCGIFVNLVFALASQAKGAVATPSFLLLFDWFCRKEWGDDYYERKDEPIFAHSNRQRTIEEQIAQYFQQVTYSINQPSAARGNQSVFWNVSIFDKPFYDTMYGEFFFPDGSKPQWESFNWLQRYYLYWLNIERYKCVLTFPVVSVCLIYKDGKFVDESLAKLVAQEYTEGNSFFTYINDTPESLSSCCRLSSKIEKPQFNFTNGQLGEMTGSKNVITLNFNRIIQDWFRYHGLGPRRIDDTDEIVDLTPTELLDRFNFVGYLKRILERIYKYQYAYNAIMHDMYDAGLMTVYNAGFITLDKQYLTIGINGLNQGAEFLGIWCNKNEEYRKFCNLIFSTIKEENKAHKTKDAMFNTEFTPCESAAIKLYNRDKEDGYWVPRDTNLYASYIFKPNDPNISVLDKLYLHGNVFCGDMLDGGSACHLNLDHNLDYEQNWKILNYAAQVGCKYWTFNVINSECDDCHYIAKEPFKECPKCGSTHIIDYSRPIGYLTAIKNWSTGRQIEQKTRIYHANTEEI